MIVLVQQLFLIGHQPGIKLNQLMKSSNSLIVDTFHPLKLAGEALVSQSMLEGLRWNVGSFT
jgi:hypothetical protein